MGAENTTNETIIYTIKLNVDQTTAALKEFATAAAAARKATADLGTANVETTAQAERQTEAAKKTAEALKVEEDSIKALRDANKQLTAERNAASTSTDAGKAKIMELNKQLDQNNTKIKENVDAQTKQKMSVGGYTAALDKLVPGLGATTNGIISATKAAWAFVATPVGAVLAAIAAALYLVSQYFTRTEAGSDAFTKKMAQLTAILNVILDRVAMLGESLVKLFSGDFIGAAEEAGQAVSGVTDEMIREVHAARELADMLDQLEDRELSYGVAASETTNQIKLLIIQSKNRTLSEQARIDKLKEATDLEVKQNEVLKQIRMDQISATTRQIEIDFNQLGVRKQVNQSEYDFAKSIVDNSAITIEARTKVADAIKAYNDVEGQSLELQQKIADRIDLLADKAQARREKEAAAKEAAAQAEIDAMQKWYAAQDAREQKEIAADKARQARSDAALAKDIARIKERQKNELDAADKQLAYQNAVASNEASVSNSRLHLMKTLYTSIGALMNAFGVKSRLLSSGLAIANTFLGVTEILKAPTAPFIEPFASIVRGIQIGTTVATGLAAVARINGVQFADGGSTSISGTRISKNHGTQVRPMANGDNLVATVRTGEVILNARQQAALGGAQTFRDIGVPGFAGGGVTGNIETRHALSAMDKNNLDDLLQIVQQLQPVLVLQDFEAKQNERDRSQNNAVVL